MGEITKHEPGTFCWIDLSTNDIDGAKKFYNGLFGWEYDDVQEDGQWVYTMILLNGKNVAGMFKLMPEMQEQGVPPFWLPYIAVTSVDETIASVDANGGGVIAPAMDVFDDGRLGVITDPEGAALGLWQPKTHIGFQYKQIHGTYCWSEHASHDQSKSTPFMEKVFGWNSANQNMGGMDYTNFTLGEVPVGGSYLLPPEMSQVPANWLNHFEVSNIDEALEKAVGTGGTIILPKMHVPGVGHFGLLQDPQGAVFGVVQGER